MQPKTTSRIREYTGFLQQHYGLRFSDYDSLHTWSIAEQGLFWESIACFFDVDFDSPYQEVFVPGAHFWETKWFTEATLNYAKHIFKNASSERAALVFQNETEKLVEISWAQLISKTYAFQKKLIALGVTKGDAVVCFGTNSPETIAAFLATNALGAVWSSCSPDFGVDAVYDRFKQLQPKVFFAHQSYQYNGKQHDCTERIAAIQKQVQSITHTIHLDAHAVFDDVSAQIDQLQFVSVSFSDPIWVLFSSGTTGKPKALVHGTGHMLLEHLKALALHQNVCEGDTYFWYSTTGWMMWNYALSSLLCGATLCLYQGAPNHPTKDSLWHFAKDAKINHFGGGAVYFQKQMEQPSAFLQSTNFLFLKTMGSTGSPMSTEVCQKLQQQFPKTHIVSLSGGTDVCTAFVGGHPDMSVIPGEIQCKMLGASVEVWNADGYAVKETSGELVLTAPLLSMPLYLLDDSNFLRYRQSYFAMFDTVWNHGDWAAITHNGGIVVYGRSDATLNRFGVRIGTAEIYAALAQFQGIDDALMVHLQHEDKDELVLFIQSDTEWEYEEIKSHIRKTCSPRHVPDQILSAPEIPYTISGKKVEIPVKRLLQGEKLENVISLDALKNPNAMQWFLKAFG